MGGQPLANPGVDDRRTSLALLGLLTLAGAALRAVAATWGLTPDEVGSVFPGGVVGNWAHGETAVNPPLLRMLVAGLSPELRQMPFVGRAISVVAGAAAIPAMFALGRLVGRDRNDVGLAAAAFVAFLPMAVMQAAMYRNYGVLLLVVVWHLVALVRAVDAPDSWPRRIQLGASAFLLPQLHYAMVPVLLAEGLAFAAWTRRPGWVGAYVPAALGFAPLAWRILEGRSEHLAPSMGTLGELVHVGHDHLPVIPVLMLASVAVWRRWDARQRTLLVALGTCLIGFGVVAAVHEARRDLAIVPAAYQLPLIAALPLLLPERLPRWPAWLVLLLLLQPSRMGSLAGWMASTRPEDGPPRLAAELEAGTWPADRPTWVYPGQHVHAVYFYVAGDRLFTTCPVDPDLLCFETEQTGVFAFDPALSGPAWLACFEPCADRAAAGCTRVRDEPGYELWDCP